MVHRHKGSERAVFGHEAILTRPHLAAHIGAVATIWTVIEESWGHILAEALDTEAKTGIAMYLALTGATSQNAILLEAVKMHLPESIQEMVTAARKAEKVVAGDRNRIVHGRWGVLPNDERYLVLGERDWLPRALAHTYKEATREVSALTPRTRHPEMVMMLYSENDFVQIEGRMMAHYTALGSVIQAIDAWRNELRLLRLMILPQARARPGLLGSPETAPKETE